MDDLLLGALLLGASVGFLCGVLVGLRAGYRAAKASGSPASFDEWGSGGPEALKEDA